MSNRRCVDTELIRSREFFTLPASAQALYIALIADADDDGIVDAHLVLLRMPAEEDDLVILKKRNFIYMLNEYLAYLENWTDFNKLDKRYKKNSKHLELLRKLRPDVKITEPIGDKEEQTDKNGNAQEKSEENSRESRGNPTGDSGESHEEDNTKEKKEKEEKEREGSGPVPMTDVVRKTMENLYGRNSVQAS